MRYWCLSNDLLLIAALLKRAEHLMKVPDPSPTLTMLVRPPEASSDNGSATEREVDSWWSPSRGDSIGESIFIVQNLKIAGDKNVEKSTFFADARPPLFIVVFKVTQVLGGLQMVATVSRSGRDSAGGSIECESEKEVSGESIVVLSS